MGQPPHEPTQKSRETVMVMHAHAIPHRIIANLLEIDSKTLRKHYATELRDAKLRVEAAMGAAIVRAAQNGAWGAAKYWLQTHGSEAWKIPPHMRDAENLPPPGQTNTTIIIKGGLPDAATIYATTTNGEDDEEAPPPRPNGEHRGNGSDHII
jgi:hypothetical protein